MNQHRPVPQIGRGPQGFGRAVAPPIPHPMMPMPQPVLGQSQQPTYEHAISEQMAEMAMEIYTRLAVDHIRARGEVVPGSKALASLANSAQMAAQAYFEQLGVQFEDPQP